MFDRYNVAKGISSTLELSRAYALVGLLRQVSDSTPDDLVYMYLNDTDNSGLFQVFREQLVPTTVCAGQIDPVRHTLNMPTLPEALRKMAHEYFVRVYWAQISSITYRYGYWTRDSNEESNKSFHTDRVYPAYVRQAIDRLPLAEYADLANFKHDIDAFCTSIAPIASSSYNDYMRCDAERKERFDVLSHSQMRKLQNLDNALCQYRYKMEKEGLIPNPVHRATLCNILDAYILLYSSDVHFVEARRYKQLYEFSKLSSAFTGQKKMIPSIAERTYGNNIDYRGRVDTGSILLSKLSPEAALIFGVNTRLQNMIEYTYCLCTDTYTCWWDRAFFTEFLKRSNPRPLTEVQLFVSRELMCQREKIKLAREIFLKEHPQDSRNFSCSEGKCCDSCCG